MSGIYVHIPYCKSHCTYCAFYSELLRNGGGPDCFVDALCREIRDAAGSGTVQTLYFGGGTPSVLSVEQLGSIVEALKSTYNLEALQEFTIEVNPDDVVKNGMAYLAGLKKLGVNRVSMGVQSFDDVVLKRMGRRHDAAEAVKAYGMLCDAGFANISIDFIFGFVNNLDINDMRAALEALPGGMPEHVSCYQLSVEEGSGLDKMVQKGLYEMPSDEECERQYYAFCDMLKSLGYEHYEISNWTRPGFRSRHNSSYWHHIPYVGFGPGAHSLFIDENGVFTRRWNNPDLEAYTAAGASGHWEQIRGGEILTAEQVAQERLFLGLRTVEGIDGKSIPEDKWFISDSIIADML